MNMDMNIVLYGFIQCLTPMNLGVSIISLFVGILFGALPGFTATMAVAVFIPFSYWLPPAAALLMLSGLFCGGIYAGSITAILLGIPGTPASVPTIFDAIPLRKQGQAGRCLGLVTWCSAFGGVASALSLLIFAPILASVAVKVGPPEQFALAVFGLSVVCILTSGNMIKGITVGIFSLILASVGQDPIHAFPRFTFGNFQILTGMPLIPILIGVFSLPEVFRMIEEGIKKKLDTGGKVGKVELRLKDIKDTLGTTIRSSLIGVGIGILPAAGPDIAAFISYNNAVNTSKDPESFGKGNIHGIVAGETANNACTGSSLVPLVTLGIPGSAPAALYLGALFIHGLRPGTQLFSTGAPIVYTMMAGFLVINVLMLFQGLLFCKIAANVVKVSRVILVPCIACLAVLGAFAMQQSMFDVLIMVIVSIIAYILQKYGFPVSPIALGLILGPMMEQTLGQSMIMFRGNFFQIFSRPLAVVFLVLAVFSLAWPALSKRLFKKSAKAPE